MVLPHERLPEHVSLSSGNPVFLAVVAAALWARVALYILQHFSCPCCSSVSCCSRTLIILLLSWAKFASFVLRFFQNLGENVIHGANIPEQPGGLSLHRLWLQHHVPLGSQAAVAALLSPAKCHVTPPNPPPHSNTTGMWLVHRRRRKRCCCTLHDGFCPTSNSKNPQTPTEHVVKPLSAFNCTQPALDAAQMSEDS